MLAEGVAGLEGLLVGVVGFGVIGRRSRKDLAVPESRSAFYDPAPAATYQSRVRRSAPSR